MGMKKPAPQAFLKILSEHNIAPENTLFIDDNEGHLRCAREAGLHVFHYKNRMKFDFIRSHIYALDEKNKKLAPDARSMRARL